MSSGNNGNVRISTETVTKTFAEIVVNGKSQGKREINGGPSLKEFATALAKEFGIRTFTVSVDGDSVTAETATASVPANSTVAVQAKDSRGSDETQEEQEAEDDAEAEIESEDEQALEQASSPDTDTDLPC